MFYAQVALENLPEDRLRLRQTLVPIVHFVVRRRLYALRFVLSSARTGRMLDLGSFGFRFCESRLT